MRQLNEIEEKIAKELGDDGRKPLVQFFDHAVLDSELTEQSGRPRYQAKVYIRMVPSNPTLIVRDIFDRAMEESDKTEWPEEWARYCQRKAGIDNLDPPITAIPGMGVAQHKELNALNIYRCADFVGYDGDLDELEGLRDVARRIIEVADEVREGRVAVRNGAGGQVHDSAEVSGQAKPTAKSRDYTRQEQGQAGPEITYSFTQGWA